MSSRVQTLLLAVLAVAAVAMSAVALQPREAPVANDAPVPRRSSSAPATPLASATPTAAISASPAAGAGRAVTATQGRPRPVVAFLGDSYIAGVGASAPRAGYVSLLGGGLEWDTKGVGLSGAVYVPAAGRRTVAQAIAAADLPTLAPDLVVLQAGRNDARSDPTELQRAVADAVLAVRALAAQAQVDVVGVLWPGRPPSEALRADRAIEAGARAADAFFTRTVDVRFPTVETTVQPTDRGHALIARRLASSFSDLGLLAR